MMNQKFINDEKLRRSKFHPSHIVVTPLDDYSLRPKI